MVSSKSLLFIFLVVISSISRLESLEPNFFQDNYCYNIAVNGTYGKNLDHLLSNLPFSNNATASTGFYSSSYGKILDKAYATGFCRGDLKAEACVACLRDSASRLLTNACPDVRDAFIWYEKCTLRYSNRSIYGIMNYTHTSSEYTGLRVDKKNEFSQRVTTFLGSLRSEALISGGDVRNFASGQSNRSIYGLMQCSPDLSEEDCNSCLSEGLNQLKCCYASWSFVTISCNIRYEPYLFSELTQSPSPSATTTVIPLSPSVSDTTSNAEGGKITHLGQSTLCQVFLWCLIANVHWF